MTFSKKYLVLALVALMLVPAMAVAADVDVVFWTVDRNDDLVKSAKIEILNDTDDAVCSGKPTSGKLTCNNLDDNEDYTIKVTEKTGYDTLEVGLDGSDLEDLSDDDIVAIVMRSTDANEVTIAVVDDGDDPVKGAKVTLESLDSDLDVDDFDTDYALVILDDDNAFDYEEDDTTDTDGEVTFENLELNVEYQITVEKSGFTTKVDNFTLEDDGDNIEVVFSEPGTASYKAVVKDQDGAFVQGALVQLVGEQSVHTYSLTTNANGEAILTVYSPETYDVAVTKDGYSTASAVDWVATNDAQKVAQLQITSENHAPVANAGADVFALVGDTVTLDASGSSDADGDGLTYTWADSMGTIIPSAVTPAVVFTTAGVHVITLTVSDGRDTSTDEMTVTVESLENCGDNVCSLAERTINECPVDCPVCLDVICGAGEANATSAEYCPVDCGVQPRLITLNESAIIAGNTTEILIVDATSGLPIPGARVVLTSPNGTVQVPDVFIGRATLNFSQAGIYTIEVLTDNYAPLTTEVEVIQSSDLSWLIWVIAIILIIAVVYLIVKYVGMGGGGGKRGYRANSFRRRKPTLSSV